MATRHDATDPKGLVREAYRIDGITPEECRSIFLDWALSLPVEQDQNACLRVLVVQYADTSPDHPMSDVLREGLHTLSSSGRRGGWRARRSD